MMIQRAMGVLLACAVSAQAGGWFSGDGISVGTIRATNSATIGGTLAVSNSATIGGSLGVSNSATIGQSLSISNNIFINGPYPPALLITSGDVVFGGGTTSVDRLSAGIINATIISSTIFTSRYITAAYNGYFSGPASGLYDFPPSVVQTNDARYANALTNEADTLATVISRSGNAGGQSATNFADVSGTGRLVFGTGLDVTNIASAAVGAQQSGYNSSTQTITGSSYGAIQIGFNQGTRAIQTAYGAIQNGHNRGVQSISSAVGAMQSGRSYGTQTIGANAHGASQNGENAGTQEIGGSAAGAAQRGKVVETASATNNGTGAMQLFDLTAGQQALTTSDGDASILLGAGTSSNQNAIVACTADGGQESHGNGSITAGGGFYGPTATITATLTASNIIQTSGGWDDLLFPVSSIYAVGLTDIEYLPQSNSINFKTTCNTNFASDNVWLVGQLSHSTKTNSAYISPHLHFVQTSATQTNIFFIRYKRYKIGDAVPTTWTDMPVTNNTMAYTSGTIHQIAEGANIAGPFGISENFDFKIWSRGGSAVQLKFFDIHFMRDGLGSDSEYSKSF
jgi:hypothetical protein